MTANAIILRQKTGRLAEVLEERAGVKGPTLQARLQRARRLLPREVRAAGARIVAAERRADEGGMRDVDALRFDQDYRLVLRHLQGLDARARQRARRWALLRDGVTAFAAGMLLGLGLVSSGVI